MFSYTENLIIIIIKHLVAYEHTLTGKQETIQQHSKVKLFFRLWYAFKSYGIFTIALLFF